MCRARRAGLHRAALRHGQRIAAAVGTPLPLGEAVRLLRPVAAALDYAHQQGIIHGALKPGNILIARTGQVLLVDLGIAQLLPRGSSLLMAATGRYYGTPEYLSPEQAHGLALDEQTDEYALGIILYEALVGRPPFRAESPDDTPRAVAARHITAAPPPPRLLNPDLSVAVEQVLLRALAKDPERRFPTCSDLVETLAEAGGAFAASTSILSDAGPQQTALLMTGTELLAPGEESDTAPEPGLAERLAAQHAAELRVLTSAYETQLAAQAETLRGRDAMIATLTQQVPAAQEEQTRLQARLAEFEALTRERIRWRRACGSWTDAGPERAGQRPGDEQFAAPPAGRPWHSASSRSWSRNASGCRTGSPSRLASRRRSGATPIAYPPDDHYISAHHAQLARQVDGWWVTDLGTTNGTFVNGVRVTAPTLINAGMSSASGGSAPASPDAHRPGTRTRRWSDFDATP